nr:MAG TPA: hypothetical protein [Caudoviricetes sp.]
MSINFLNITHISKKTGNSTIIFDNTNSAGMVITTDGDLLTGVPITESMDDGMNTAVLHLKACNGANVIPELFEPYDIIEITEKTNNLTTKKQYLVGIDHRQIDNAYQKTYEKTVSLVEPTKILDTIYVYNCNLTRKGLTLPHQVTRLLTNVEPRLTTENGRFTLHYATDSELGKYSSEDFFFDNITLREALYRIFEVAHIVPYVSEISVINGDIIDIVIGHKSKNEFTPITDLSGYGEYMGDEGEVSIDNYFGTLKARGYNSVSKNRIKTGVVPFSTTEETMNSDNMIADFRLPIEDILKFNVGSFNLAVSIKAGMIGGEPDEYTGTISFFWDFSKMVVDGVTYDMLSVDEQQNHLPYTKGDSVVDVSKKYKLLIFTQSTLRKNITDDLAKGRSSQLWEYLVTNNVSLKNSAGESSTSYLAMPAIELDITTPLTGLFFQSEFIPRIDTLIEVSKPGVYDNDRLKIGILDGQNANSIDIVRHGRTLGGLARRTGNEELMLDFHCDDFSQLMPVMGKFSGLTGRNSYLNGYVITKREHSVYDNQIKVRYYCTKDYQAINERIGVNREKRLYEIPLEATDCPIHIKYYVTATRYRPATSKQAFSPDFASRLITGILDWGRNEDSRISYMYFKCPESGLDKTQVYALPCLAYGADKNVVLMAQPLDNYSAGYTRGGRKLDFIAGGGVQMIFNPYVNSYGEATNFSLYLASKQGVDNNIASGGGTYPKITIGGEETRTAPIDIKYYKDRTQRPVFFVSFEFLPKQDSYGEIVFGEAVATQNAFVISETQPKHLVYVGDKPYETGDTKVNGDILKNGSESLDSYDFFNVKTSGDYVSIVCIKTIPFAGKKSIAISDYNGNLIMGFNFAVSKGDEFYFEISRKL